MVKIHDNKYYICVILDLFSRMVVGWMVSTQNNDNLTVNTFKQAYESRNRPTSLSFHSDQGKNYTSNKYRGLLFTLQVSQSFSKKGTPYDNAPIESFFSNFKKNHLNNFEFNYLDELIYSVNNYIEYYNNFRPHKSLGFKTLMDYELKYKK